MYNYLNIFPGNKKILLIGTFPPPPGGVSIHVYRLYHLLKANQRKVDIFDVSSFYGHKYIKFALLFLRLKSGGYDIVHLHNTGRGIISTILKAKKKENFRLIFTDHNPRLFTNITEKTKNFYRIFLQKVDLHIAVSQQVLTNYSKNGIKLNGKSILLNAFLPPNMEEENKIINKYSDELKRFINTKRPLLVANAYRLSFFNNEDLYGFDMCIELMKELVTKYPNAGLFFALADSKYNTGYLITCREKIKNYGLEKNFFLFTNKQEIWPVVKQSDIFIRPTNTDGDSISIREALLFKCSVLASDISDRPKEVILFKSRDQIDFNNKVFAILKNRAF